MHNIFRKSAFLFCLALGFVTLHSAAETYPDRLVRIIDGYSPGGSTDYLARYIASKSGSDFPAGVIVENRQGAGGQIGMASVSKSKPDGYTFMVLPNELWSVAPLLYKRLPFNVERDFVPVTSIADVPVVLTVSAKVAAGNTAELINYARQNPGKLTFGSAGAGTLHHLSAELFKSMAKVDMVHVPYKGTSLAVSDLLSNQIDIVFSPITAVLPHIRSGKLRALAVTGKKRVAALPGTPTVAESGVPGYESNLWVFMAAPANTPNEIIQKWSAQTQKVMATEDARNTLAVQGVEAVALSQAEMRQRIKDDAERWQKVINDAKITIE